MINIDFKLKHGVTAVASKIDSQHQKQGPDSNDGKSHYDKR